MGRPSRAVPRDLCTDWPARESTDPVAEVARRFAVALAAAVGDQSLRAVAARAGVTHTTITRVLEGRLWPDMVTISRLEIGLGVPLWPAHRSM